MQSSSLLLITVYCFLNYFLGQGWFTSADSVSDPTQEDLPPLYANEIKFYHFTSRYPSGTYKMLNANDTGSLRFISGKIYLLMHGFGESRDENFWYKGFTEIMMKKYVNSHIIQTDYSTLNKYSPFVAIRLVPAAGQIIGDLLATIFKSNILGKEIVLLGNSLGGQMAAFVAKRFETLTNRRISRIEALDPAGLGFNTSTTDKRLSPANADNVVVIHTDQIFGIGNVPTGHLDFYPNGGILQTGCPPIPPYDFTKVRPTNKDAVMCHHVMVNHFFVEALRAPEHFLAKKCRDYESFKKNDCENVQVSMGDLETTRRGSFYLTTTADRPYYKRRTDTVKNKKRN